MRLRILSLLTALALAALGFAADENADGRLVGSVSLNGEASTDIIERAIIKAAQQRNWKLIETAPQRIQIHLLHRKYDATLTFVYSSDVIRIYSDSYRLKKDGSRGEPSDPEGWIKNLESDIRVFTSLYR